LDDERWDLFLALSDFRAWVRSGKHDDAAVTSPSSLVDGIGVSTGKFALQSHALQTGDHFANGPTSIPLLPRSEPLLNFDSFGVALGRSNGNLTGWNRALLH
jgi:hypothetical protein